MSEASLWPLFDRFPALASLPRATLRRGPTPVESLAAVAPGLWIKRDDLTASPIGGNKVRSLEFLLGGVTPGARVTTAGSRGSTHSLATAIHGQVLGATVTVGAWPQEMNSEADRVEDLLLRTGVTRKSFANAPLALSWLWWRQLRGDHVVPAGGTSALGILGHVNAALELATQVEHGLLPEPRRVVVPLGSGGTAAGLALGFALAGMRTTIMAARVVPRIVGRRGRVMRLGRSAKHLISRYSRQPLPRMNDVVVYDDAYGGAYGRPFPDAARGAEQLREAVGLTLDSTYAAKAFAAALKLGGAGDTLFWSTFDARWMTRAWRADDRIDRTR